MADVKRICSLCGVDRTPLTGGIYPVNDRRGDCLGLFGECCHLAVYEAVRRAPRCYRHAGEEWIFFRTVKPIILGWAREILDSKKKSVTL